MVIFGSYEFFYEIDINGNELLEVCKEKNVIIGKILNFFMIFLIRIVLLFFFPEVLLLK